MISLAKGNMPIITPRTILLSIAHSVIIKRLFKIRKQKSRLTTPKTTYNSNNREPIRETNELAAIGEGDTPHMHEQPDEFERKERNEVRKTT